MKLNLTLSTENGDVLPFDVESSETVENVKALIEVVTGILLNDQAILHNGKDLQNQSTLDQCGVKQGDLLFVARRQQAPQSIPNDPASFRDYVRNNPQLMQQLLNNDPALAEAVLAEDLSLLASIMTQRTNQRKQVELQRMQEIEQLNSDPFNLEYQQKIEEAIRMENVNENMENALEHNPEAFARVIMLYIDCNVNNTPVKAFVDSGAQQTIMSQKCAERCGIMRLVDTRYHGIAKGVGTARIIGRVHLAPIKIGSSFFPCAFTILEDQGMDFLLGLDMLRRHQCSIDLKDNALKIGTEAVPFLAEKDIPRNFMFEGEESSTSAQPQPQPQLQIKQPNPTTTTTAPPVTVPKPVTATTAQPRQQQPNPAPAQSADSTAVTQLMGLGFSREEVLHALRMFNGDAERAASFLFGGGF